MTTTFTPDTDELRKIAELPTESALRRAARFPARLVKDPDFVAQAPGMTSNRPERRR